MTTNRKSPRAAAPIAASGATPSHDPDGKVSTIERVADYGLAVHVTRDDGKPGGRFAGVVRGWAPDLEGLDVSGEFDAEICPRTCP